MSRFKTLEDIDPAGKTVLLRVDLNVPMDEKGKVTDDTRIRAILPSVMALTSAGAKVALLSHFGRPKGRVDPKLSLAPLAPLLSAALGRPTRGLYRGGGGRCGGRAAGCLAARGRGALGEPPLLPGRGDQ